MLKVHFTDTHNHNYDMLPSNTPNYFCSSTKVLVESLSKSTSIASFSSPMFGLEVLFVTLETK